MSIELTTPIPDPTLPLDAYYDSSGGKYLVTDRDGNWMPIDATTLRLRLRKKKLLSRSPDKEALSQVDDMLLRIQDERNVQYVGLLAGYQRGMHIMNEAKILVTHSPKIVTPVKGNWSIIEAIVNGQFKDEMNQHLMFHSWVKLAEQSFRSCVKNSRSTYGQTLIMAGPKNCGKSLLQKVITLILGGRQAKSYRYMSGNTNFNRELFGAEHQVIEDDQPFKDYHSRVRFGDAIKNVSATVGGSCHGKSREAINLTPFWRLTVSVNDSPDNLEILPPFDDSMLDKIIMLHCAKVDMPMPSGNDDEQALFMAEITKQLPAYLWWIQNEFEIPADIKSNARYGMKAFFHPYIMGLLSDFAPETRLLAIIDQVLFQDSMPEWEGTSEELGQVLFTSTYKYQAKQVIPMQAGPGKLLGKLASQAPERVVKKHTKTTRLWCIKRMDGVTRTVLNMTPTEA